MENNPNKHENEEGKGVEGVKRGLGERNGVVQGSGKFGHTIARANDNHDHGNVLLGSNEKMGREGPKRGGDRGKQSAKC